MCSYKIHFILKKPVVLEIGKLGRFEFPAGEYVYTGSARRNMEARISRHSSRKKKLRWHIDYLLAASPSKIIGVELFDREECVVNQEAEGAILVPRFGATDCKNGCGSHLKYRGQPKMVAPIRTEDKSRKASRRNPVAS
jgi:Uri superfamily endonuclease